MTKQSLFCAAGLLVALVVRAPSARAIETTYGEDPVPNSQCYDGYINLGYGIDPIPSVTPSERWQQWRAILGKPPSIGLFKRQVRPTPSREPLRRLPSSRRGW